MNVHDHPAPVPGPSSASHASAGVPQTTLHMPVDIRSASLALIAVIASLAVLRWAADVFIPLLLGIMFSYALSPVVDRLARWHVPRAIGAALLLGTLAAGAGSAVYALADDAQALVRTLPDAALKLRHLVQREHVTPAALETVQQAAAQLEKAADESSASPRRSGVQRVQIEQPRFNVHDYLWSGTVGLLGLVGQTLVVGFITYFMLTSGDSFRRKLVRLAGPTFARRKITVQALNEINHQIQLYLVLQLAASALVGLVTGFAFHWLGLEHAAVWGIAAGVLNLVPYIGSLAVTVAATIVALLQFGSMDKALIVGAVSVLIQIVEGYGLTPWLTGRACRMSAVVVFVSVLAWGWLWGAWGLLLGVPIMMVVKTVCDRVDDLKPLGELLGSETSRPA